MATHARGHLDPISGSGDSSPVRVGPAYIPFYKVKDFWYAIMAGYYALVIVVILLLNAP